MASITAVRPVLISSPYADADEPEVLANFPNGPKRTIGLVEITVDDGTTGLGEGYLAVFAPTVFREIVELMAPHLIGRDASDIAARVDDAKQVSDYWSQSGAARHVISAIDTALIDVRGKQLGKPAWVIAGGTSQPPIDLYGSGGNCLTRAHFERELDMLSAMGIRTYKIRSGLTDVDRASWAVHEAARRGIGVAIDLCQNLARHPASPDDVVRFVQDVESRSGANLRFVEEPLAPQDEVGFRRLREKLTTPVAGGETITTPRELIDRIDRGFYDIAQPDASVIGGISAITEVAAAARGVASVTVHAWGGPIAQLANYHAAIAIGSTMGELPMLASPLARLMTGLPALVEGGRLVPLTHPGLGAELTPEIEQQFAFDPSAVYDCAGVDPEPPGEDWSFRAF